MLSYITSFIQPAQANIAVFEFVLKLYGQKHLTENAQYDHQHIITSLLIIIALQLSQRRLTIKKFPLKQNVVPYHPRLKKPSSEYFN